MPVKIGNVMQTDNSGAYRYLSPERKEEREGEGEVEVEEEGDGEREGEGGKIIEVHGNG